MKLNDGIKLVGHLVTFEVTEWTQGKFNQQLVIDNPYTDKYGNTSTNYFKVNVHREDVANVQKFAHENQGARVLVNVGLNLKSGISGKTQKPYAFNEFYIPKGEPIEVLTSSAQLKAAS